MGFSVLIRVCGLADSLSSRADIFIEARVIFQVGMVRPFFHHIIKRLSRSEQLIYEKTKYMTLFMDYPNKSSLQIILEEIFGI